MEKEASKRARRSELVSALSVKLQERHVSRSSRHARVTRTQCLPEWILLFSFYFADFMFFCFSSIKNQGDRVLQR